MLFINFTGRPVLLPVLVGALMMTTLKEIDWEDAAIAIPAFLTLLAIPLTYSIANGLAAGFIVYDALQIAKGRGGRVPWLTHVLAALFLLRFVYLAQG